MWRKVKLRGISPYLMDSLHGATQRSSYGDTPYHRAVRRMYDKPVPRSVVERCIEALHPPLGAMVVNGLDDNPILAFTPSCPFAIDIRPINFRGPDGSVQIFRPRFDEWTITFILGINLHVISGFRAREILDQAGKEVGIGELSPAQGGIFGRFVVDLWE